MLQKSKKGNLLTENVIFIILNLIFFGMLVGYLYIQSSSTHLEEQATAKEIARPGTSISLNLEKLFEKSDSKEISRQSVIKIDNDLNLVSIKGSEDSFYDYSYFNDAIQVSYVINENNLVMTIEEKNEI